MKITEIRLNRKKNLGSYESCDLGFTVVVGDDENAIETIERAKKLLDWAINKEERDLNYKRYAKRFEEIEVQEAAAELDEKVVAERKKLVNWMTQYESTKAEIEAMR